MTFISGHQLSRALYDQIVAPLMAERFPNLPWAAALIGTGSDVLGYDTDRSMDHDWGPRLAIVLRNSDLERSGSEVFAFLEASLPESIAGIPIDIPGAADLPGGEVHHNTSEGKVRHHGVTVTNANSLLKRHIGIDLLEQWDEATWLTVPQQSILELIAGPMFRDDHGELTELRSFVEWMPDQLWFYLMASMWQRVAQLEAFIGRTGSVEDDLGSQAIAMSIARDVMRLALLQHRRYAPYAKWLGTAFRELPIALVLQPLLDRARFATDWQGRESGIVQAVQVLAEFHNELGITPTVDPTSQQFFDRPYQVLYAERYSIALHERIDDPRIRKLPYDIGAFETLSDSTLALANSGLRTAIANWFRTEIGEGQ